MNIFENENSLNKNIYKISDKKARVISGYIWDIMAFKFAKICNKNNETLFICHKNDLTTKLHLNVPNTKTWLSVEAPELTSNNKKYIIKFDGLKNNINLYNIDNSLITSFKDFNEKKHLHNFHITYKQFTVITRRKT